MRCTGKSEGEHAWAEIPLHRTLCSTTSSCRVRFRAISGPSCSSRQVTELCLCATGCLLGTVMQPTLQCELARGPPMIGGGVQSHAVSSSIAEMNRCELPAHPLWDSEGRSAITQSLSRISFRLQAAGMGPVPEAGTRDQRQQLNRSFLLCPTRQRRPVALHRQT